MAAVTNYQYVREQTETAFQVELLRVAQNLLDVDFNENEANKSNLKAAKKCITVLKGLIHMEESASEKAEKTNLTDHHVVPAGSNSKLNPVQNKTSRTIAPKRYEKHVKKEETYVRKRGINSLATVVSKKKDTKTSAKCSKNLRTNRLAEGDPLQNSTSEIIDNPQNTNTKTSETRAKQTDYAMSRQYLCLQPLSLEEEDKQKSLTRDYGRHESMNNQDRSWIHAIQFERLNPKQWLDDEIVNAFVSLLNNRNMRFRSRQAPTKQNRTSIQQDAKPIVPKHNLLFQSTRPRVHMFNSFFLHRRFLASYNYERVRRWRKKACGDVPVSGNDLFLFPFHKNMHWTLAAIDMRGRQFLYLDSRGGKEGHGIFRALGRWLKDEIAEWEPGARLKFEDVDAWKRVTNPAWMPRQTDEVSCGLFMLYNAYFLELGKEPGFSENDVDVLRGRTALFFDRGALPKSG